MAEIAFPKPYFVKKAWGYELHIHNSPDYCGKVLHFNENAKFSMHFHVRKKETWYVQSGEFLLIYINPKTAERLERVLSKGMVIEVPQGWPHQLHCIKEGDIYEVSTEHFDDDSYRVEPGDSQKV